jgi:hypothetical protein
MTRWVAFLTVALIVSPLVGVLASVGIALAGGDIGAAVILFVLPAIATLIAAVRMGCPNWAIALTPVVSGVLALMGIIVSAVFFTERPFD